MKKITFLILTLFLTTISWQVQAQCFTGNAFGTLTPSCATGANANAAGSWANEYSTVNVVTGNEYQFSLSNPVYFITVANGTGTAAFTSGTGTVNWTSTITGTVRFYSHVNNTCATTSGNATSHTRTVRCVLPPPANNLCPNAFVLTEDGTTPGTTIGATNSGTATCGTTSTSGDVWYTFTDDSEIGSTVTVNTCAATGFDTKLTVFRGSCGALICVDGNDDFCGSRSQVTFTTDGSSTYFIMVHGFGTALGDFDLTLSGFPTGVVGSPPQIICPNDIVINNTTGTCGAQVFFNNALANDAEDGLLPVTQTMGPGTGSIFPIGDTIIEYSTTDSDGNTSTCQFTITVQDVDDPIALCQDVTVELDETGTVVLNAAELNFGFGFSCTYSIGLYDTFGDGWNGGSVDVLVDGVVVLDNITLATGAGPQWFNFNVMPGQSIAVAYTAGTWSFENWFQVVDGAGGSGNVIYATPTGSTPPANNTVTNSCESGVGSSDGCGSVTFSFDQAGLVTSMVLDCSYLGENTITLYVTDEGGNVVSCESTVTVEDNIAPEIVCLGGGIPAYTAISCPGNPGPTSTFDSNLLSFSLAGENGSEIDFLNGCPGVTGLQNQTALSVDLLPGQTYTVNANSWTCGATQYAAQTYVWIDFNGDGNLTADEVVLTGAQAGVTGGGPTGGSPTGGNPFTNTFTVPANAYQGPVAIRVMTQETTITPLNPCASYSWGSMIDFTANVLNPNPGAIPQYFLDANGQVTVPLTDLYDSVSDNAGSCGITVTVGGAGSSSCQLSNAGPLVNGFGMWTGSPFTVANDLVVNEGQNFVLDQVTLDILALPAAPFNVTAVDVTYYSNSGGFPGTLIGSQDGVVPTSQVVVGSTSAPLPITDINRIVLDVDPFTFEGDEFSSTTYWIGIRVSVDTNPTNIYWGSTPNVVGNPSVSSNAGGAWAYVADGTDGLYTFSGTCEPLGGGSNAIFTCADLGVINVTVTATDASGNSTSCVTQIEIIDNIAPVLVTQDITVELDENGEASIVYQDLYGYSPDDYEVITIGSNGLAGTGNTDLTVPVTDATTISFDWNYTTTDTPGWDSFGYLLNGTYTQLTNDLITNQSGVASVGVSPGDVFGFRVMTDDNAGGAGQALVSEFVPGFQGQFAPANWTQILTNSNGSASFITIPGGVLAYDNCGISTGAVNISNFTCADIGNPVTVTVFVSDASGNIASSTAVVTVVDLLAPEFDCPADMTVDTDPDSITYTVPDYIGDGLVSVTDNCTEPITIYSQSPAPGTLLLDGTYTVTLTAEDEYGNESTCTFELTVETELGTDENVLGSAIAMYPNPASSYVSLRNSSNIALTQATIYDITGKLVSSFDLTQMVGEQRLDVSNLASGVYMVYINSETASVVKRLIKK